MESLLLVPPLMLLTLLYRGEHGDVALPLGEVPNPDILPNRMITLMVRNKIAKMKNGSLSVLFPQKTFMICVATGDHVGVCSPC